MDRHDGLADVTYVQLAECVVFDGTSITLGGLAPATVFLDASGGPSLGYLPTGLFLDRWYDDVHGTPTRAVPAVLSLLAADRGPATPARLTVSMPRIRGTGLAYRTHVLSGSLLPESGAAVLFISPLATPVTPDGPSALAR